MSAAKDLAMIKLIKDDNGMLQAYRVKPLEKQTSRKYIRKYILENEWGDGVISLASQITEEANSDWRHLYSRLAVELCEGMYRFKKSCFTRFNDPNNVTYRMSKRWFRSAERGMDSQAQELSETLGVNVTEDDICNVMLQHEDGYLKRRSDLLNSLSSEFEEKTGIKATKYNIELILSKVSTRKEIYDYPDAPF